MSIFGNMMGAYNMGKSFADSFTAGADEPLTDVEQALVEQNVPLQSPGLPSELQMALGGGLPQPQQTEMDETQVVGSAADGNIGQPGGGGGMVGNTLSGNSIAGNAMKLFGMF